MVTIHQRFEYEKFTKDNGGCATHLKHVILYRAPNDCYMSGHLPIIELAMCVCMYVSHVLDRKLLERLMSPSPKSQVMFASAFS